MNGMALLSRDRARNSNRGGLGQARYLLVTEAPHNMESFTSEEGKDLGESSVFRTTGMSVTAAAPQIYPV